MKKKNFKIVLAGILAALYIILTLPFAQISFGLVQFRLAEALTIMPALTPAGIYGVFIGCLFSNFLNPQNLGPIDIFGGSFTTLLAAYLTFKLGRPLREYILYKGESEEMNLRLKKKAKQSRIVALLPPVILNGLIIGTYLPFLLKPGKVNLILTVTTILSIMLSQAIVIYGIGFPLLNSLIKNKGIVRYVD